MKTLLIISQHFFPTFTDTNLLPSLRLLLASPFICLSCIQHLIHSPTLTPGWMNSFFTAKMQAIWHEHHGSGCTLLCNSVNLSLYSPFLLFFIQRRFLSWLFKVTLMIQAFIFIRHSFYFSTFILSCTDTENYTSLIELLCCNYLLC